MQIIVEAALEKGKIIEWKMIEFQGKFTLESKDGFSDQYIGDLNYTKDGTPFFLNGHHILYGEEVPLQKPFAILSKTIDEEIGGNQYIIKAVIRRKIIFSNRPKPIIAEEIPININ